MPLRRASKDSKHASSSPSSNTSPIPPPFRTQENYSPIYAAFSANRERADSSESNSGASVRNNPFLTPTKPSSPRHRPSIDDMDPPASPPTRRKYSPFSAFESGVGASSENSNNSASPPVPSKPPVSGRLPAHARRHSRDGQPGAKRRSTLSFEIGGGDAAAEDTATDTDDLSHANTNITHPTRNNFSPASAAARHTPQARAETLPPPPVSVSANTYPSPQQQQRGMPGLPPGAMMPAQHAQGYTSTSSDERVDVDNGGMSGGESQPLEPPRPRFLAEAQRASWSSQDSSLFDDSSSAPQSEEENNPSPPVPAHAQSVSDVPQATRRRSGQYAQPAGAAAAAPGAGQGQRAAYNAPRRYSNSHRRQSLENAQRRRSMDGPVIPRSPSPNSRPLSGAPPPPSAFRAAAVGALGVAEGDHPLSPNPSSNGHSQMGSPLTEEYHDASQDAYGGGSSNGHGSMMYAYQPGPNGYAPPPGQQGPIYPGGVNAQGAGYPYPYPHPYPYPYPQQNPNPQRPHNAFMANSAIARSSFSSTGLASANGSTADLVPYAARINGMAPPAPPSSGYYTGTGTGSQPDLSPPQPPFAGGAGYPPPSPTGGMPMSPMSPGTPNGEQHGLRNSPSSARLREPFLSPASRRSSSVWAPPTPMVYTANNLPSSGAPGFVPGDGGPGTGSGFFGGYAYNGVGTGSNTMLALPGKKEPLPSSALKRKISVSEKPWIKQREKNERASWWLTFCIMWIGVAVGAVVCFFGFSGVEKIDQNLCSVLSDDFSSFNEDTWTRNVSLGGFGNGEFEMTTASDDNLYIKNGQLYIMPTLTSDEIGTDAVFDGKTYNLTGCTESWNASDCSVTSKNSTNTVINPVKSARISTVGSVSLAYGKVEVVAKLPQGDWLWPAIWMLPKDEKYGEWPKSGEIDIMEARGNDATYPQQGFNFVRSSLNWGPLDSVIATAFGWQSLKRSNYAAGFHTYTLEWTDKFMRMSVDSKLKAMLDLSTSKESFFSRGKFPTTAQNGSTEAVVNDIWEGQPNSAPFDQEFYLIIDLAVGGTSGWFPDNVGGKMWFDGSATAMTDFAKAQDTWSQTWPSSDDERAFRIESVNMWSLC